MLLIFDFGLLYFKGTYVTKIHVNYRLLSKRICFQFSLFSIVESSNSFILWVITAAIQLAAARAKSVLTSGSRRSRKIAS